jgi:hypothetical protein
MVFASLMKRFSIADGNSISSILLIAFVVRVFMIFFGSRVLDASTADLNYTDIDYNIFTDAAQFILEGELLFIF